MGPPSSLFCSHAWGGSAWLTGLSAAAKTPSGGDFVKIYVPYVSSSLSS